MLDVASRRPAAPQPSQPKTPRCDLPPSLFTIALPTATFLILPQPRPHARLPARRPSSLSNPLFPAQTALFPRPPPSPTAATPLDITLGTVHHGQIVSSDAFLDCSDVFRSSAPPRTMRRRHVLLPARPHHQAATRRCAVSPPPLQPPLPRRLAARHARLSRAPLLQLEHPPVKFGGREVAPSPSSAHASTKRCVGSRCVARRLVLELAGCLRRCDSRDAGGFPANGAPSTARASSPNRS